VDRRGISHKLGERQLQLIAGLQGTPSSRFAPSSASLTQTSVDTMQGGSDTGPLESQVRGLRQEVIRLREIMEIPGDAPPPRYYRGSTLGPQP